MKRIFIFPGQGSQSVGMGKELVEQYPVAKNTFAEANESLGFDLQKICFEGPEEELKLTYNTQPAILTHSIAVFRVLQEKGFAHTANFVAGHSLGEYSALVASGAILFSDAVRIVHKRGQFMQEAVPVGTGSMAALIGATEASTQQLCELVQQKTKKICEAANFNGGGQVVISGHKEAIEEAARLVDSQSELGISRAVILPVSAPFHCSLMKPAEENLKPFLDDLSIHSLNIPYIANVDAKLYSDSGSIRQNLLKQIASSVRWEQSMQLLPSLEVTEAYEIGPGKVLTTLFRRIDRKLPAKAIGTLEDLQAIQ